MKIFIYKLLIAVFFLYILFEFTIGARIDLYSDKINYFESQQKRIEIKNKIISEMKKGTEKENFFNQEERIVISNFIRKILSELKINTNQ